MPFDSQENQHTEKNYVQARPLNIHTCKICIITNINQTKQK